MYTNGTLVDDAAARRFAQLGNVCPSISVEGFERETDALREAGVPFGISMTATRENADVLLSEDVVRHFFDDKGAVLAWIFHYMPIGRSSRIDQMVIPEQRRRMLERQLDLMKNRGLFFIDFWNGGALSAGCISAGREGGYFHIDWNGDVAPCVFIPTPSTTSTTSSRRASGSTRCSTTRPSSSSAPGRWTTSGRLAAPHDGSGGFGTLALSRGWLTDPNG